MSKTHKLLQRLYKLNTKIVEDEKTKVITLFNWDLISASTSSSFSRRAVIK